MNPVDDLANYLDRVERRLRLLAWARGAATVTAVALALTVALAGILTWVTFSPPALRWCRLLLWAGAGLAGTCALLIPLWRLNPRAAVLHAERRHRGFEQRLLTFTEHRRGHSADPFLPFLAADTLEVAAGANPETFARIGALMAFAAVGAAASAVLVWLILEGPGRLGYDVQALWAARKVFSVEARPARKTVSRGSDLPVAAHLNGFAAGKADLWVRYANSAKWKQIPMLEEGGASDFGWKLTEVPDDAEFYVQAEGVRSPVARVRAVDLPRVKNIVVTYAYPAEMSPHMPGADTGDGDLVAPAGTVASLQIETDRPMNGGELVLDDGNPIQLADTQDNRTPARLIITRGGAYHVGVKFGGEPVQVSKDYAIVVLGKMPYRKGPRVDLPDGVRAERSGSVPAEYEQAVAEYFRRLNALKKF